jgi:signal transduction histidine kinase
MADDHRGRPKVHDRRKDSPDTGQAQYLRDVTSFAGFLLARLRMWPLLLVAVVALLADLSVANASPPGLLLLGSGIAVMALTVTVRHLYEAGRRWPGIALTGIAVALSLSTSVLLERIMLQRTPGSTETLGLLLLLALTCRKLSFWQIMPTGPALVVAITQLGSRMRVTTEAPVVGDIGGLLALLPVMFAVAGFYLRSEDNRRAVSEDRIRQAERLELARDLHDHVAHYVTAIVVQAQAGEQVVHRDPATGQTLFGNIERTGQEGLVAMSRMVRLLRDPDATPEPPRSAALHTVEQRVAGFREEGHPVSLQVADGVDAATWPPEVAKSVERLVQEGLTNVRKHARSATSVRVLLDSTGDDVLVKVQDNATRTTRREFRPSGFGMIGLTERVDQLGGTLHSGPLAGTGWEMAARIPLR